MKNGDLMFPKVHRFPDKIGWKAIGISSPEDVGKFALVPGDPKRVEKIIQNLNDVTKLGEVREHVAYTGYYNGIKITVVSSGMGTPNAALTVEGLHIAGVKVIIRVGTTGALQKEINIGDLIIPIAAIRGDGATREYVPYKYPAVADIDVVNALYGASKKYNISVHRGIVWTHDALFMESRKRAEFWSKTGALGTEMECSAIFTVARLRGIKAGAILAVDGNLMRGEQFSGHGSEKLNESINAEIKIALDAVVSLAKNIEK